MTREEATKYARSKKMMLESLIYNDDCKYGHYAMYSDELSFINAVISALRHISWEQDEYAVYSAELSFINAILSALHPVSREQVEKVWRGEWIHKRSPYDYKIFVCKKCGKQISIQGENMDFCPACGAAQTDEAVQMVMERLEALKDGKGD